jgi:hypothetical protein
MREKMELCGGIADIYHKSEQQKANKGESWPNLCFGLSIITNCLVSKAEKLLFLSQKRERVLMGKDS